EGIEGAVFIERTTDVDGELDAIRLVFLEVVWEQRLCPALLLIQKLRDGLVDEREALIEGPPSPVELAGGGIRLAQVGLDLLADPGPERLQVLEEWLHIADHEVVYGRFVARRQTALDRFAESHA